MISKYEWLDYAGYLQTAPGLAASLQLARVMGLRGQEAVQCCQSLKTWDKQLEKGAERLSVIFGTKGGRPRITQVIDREAVRQAVKEALNIAGKRDGHLIDKPDLKSATGTTISAMPG